MTQASPDTVTEGEMLAAHIECAWSVELHDNASMGFLTKKEIKQIVSALRSAAAAPRGAQEGWQLVPKEPTKEMIQASIWALDRWREKHGNVQGFVPPGEKYQIRWRAMLEAAPIFTAPTVGRELPYSTPQELFDAFKGGTKFVLHYHGKTFDVTHMEPRARVVYVQPPSLPVKVFPNGLSAEGSSNGIWLSHRVTPAVSAEAVATLLDRNQRYMDSYDGKNELHCGPAMLRWALEESTAMIRSLAQADGGTK